LGAFCEKTIPRYMIPEAFFVRERFPRTSTGKIDRQKLMGQYAAEKQSPSPTPVH
jgi:acyl-CoA synthetase (AMP-forming)/AMP-acid ligase II